MAQPKTEFRNDSGGIIGVVTIEPGGKEVGLPLHPDETIWLSEEDQIATANSHQRDEDNPFVNGHLTKITNPEDVKNRRPIGDAQESPEAQEQRQRAEEAAKVKQVEDEDQAKEEAARLEAGQAAATAPKPPAPEPKPSQARQAPEETAAPKQAQGDAAQGSRAANEEVGTPEAVPSS